MRAPSAPAAEGTRIPLRPKRLLRLRFLSELTRELPNVLTVVAAGASAIGTARAGGEQALAAAELLVGAWVLVNAAREARHVFGRAHGAHAAAAAGGHDGGHDAGPLGVAVPRVDPQGIAAAAMGYVEVWHHAHVRGHFRVVSPYMLAATVTLVLALGGRRWIADHVRPRMGRRHPHLLVTPAGMHYRATRFTRWDLAWADVARVEHDASGLALHLHDGTARHVRADEHLDGHAILAAARRAVAAHAPPHLGAPADGAVSRPLTSGP